MGGGDGAGLRWGGLPMPQLLIRMEDSPGLAHRFGERRVSESAAAAAAMRQPDGLVPTGFLDMQRLRAGHGQCVVLSHTSALSDNKLVHFQLMGLHMALVALDAVAEAAGVGRGGGRGWFDTRLGVHADAGDGDVHGTEGPCVLLLVKGLSSAYKTDMLVHKAVVRALEPVGAAHIDAEETSQLLGLGQDESVEGAGEPGVDHRAVPSLVLNSTEAPSQVLRTIKRRVLLSDEPASGDQMRDLFAASDAYLAPYSAEGFNLPALEAAAVGTPVIVTQGGPTDEYLRDDVAARVPAVESQVWSKAMGMHVTLLQPDLGDLTCKIIQAILAAQPIRNDVKRMLMGLRRRTPFEHRQRQAEWLGERIRSFPSFIPLADPAKLAGVFDRLQVADAREWTRQAARAGPAAAAEGLTWRRAAGSFLTLAKTLRGRLGLATQ